jgi:hypothetical protein
MSTKTARQTRCTPLPREQRACAASVGRGWGWGLLLGFLSLQLYPHPLAPPHKGEGKALGLRPAQRTHVSANTPLKGGAACAASAMNWLRASSAKLPF